MNFKKLSILLVLVGIMIVSVVGIANAAGCDAWTQPCALGKACCNDAILGCGYKTTAECVDPFLVRCDTDLTCWAIIKAQSGKVGYCDAGTHTCAFGVKPQQAAEAPATKRTGVMHYGAELKEGKNIPIEVGVGFGATGGIISSSLGNILGALAYQITSINSALNTKIANARRHSNTADTAKHATSSNTALASGTCTIVGVRRIGEDTPWGSNACGGFLSNKDKVIVQVADDVWYTPPGGSESNMRSSKPAGFGLVLCCDKRGDTAPKVITHHDITAFGNIWFTTMKDTPVDYCDVTLERKDNYAIILGKKDLRVTHQGCGEEPWESCHFIDIRDMAFAARASFCVDDRWVVTCKYKGKATTPFVSTVDGNKNWNIWMGPGETNEVNIYSCHDEGFNR